MPDDGVRRRLAGLPLRTRLTALSTALLVVGLVLTGTVALALLQRSLVAQVDSQLAEWTPLLVERTSLPTDRQADLPTDYQVAFSSPDGTQTRWWAAAAGRTRPDLPPMTVAAVAERGTRNVTVPSDGEGGRWRVATRLLADPRTGRAIGSVAVALPLAAADATLDRMRIALVAITCAVAGAGAVTAWWGVRRSLRPLVDIEATTAAIAAGDLSRRIPSPPPTTEVGRLAEALNTMLGQLEHAFAERAASEARMRRFVSDAGHELRTPLATVRGYAELHRMGATSTPEDVTDTMRRIEGAAVRMGALVDDLLHLARLDEGRPMRREPVDLLVLAGDAAADLRALDPGRPVRMVPLDGAGGPGGGGPGGAAGTTTATTVTVGDEDRLRQVLANLVSNVARYTPSGSPVEIAVGPRDGWVLTEVRDHGPGIPAEHADRVFERFYRVDAGRDREHGGSGLGLAIVAAIVAAHAGHVRVDPTPGGGLTVRVALPAAPVGGDGAPQRP